MPFSAVIPVTNAKLLAPSTSLSLNATAGDDENDGFNNPIQTDDRLQEILETYDWGGQQVNITFTNYIGGHTYEGKSVSNIGALNFVLSFNTLTQSINIQNFQSIFILGAIFDNARLRLTDVSTCSLISVNYQNQTVNELVEAIRVTELSTTFLGITDCSCDQAFSFENVESADINLGTYAGTNSFNLVKTSKALGHVKLSASFPTPITGKIVDTVIDESGGASFEINFGNLTETIASTYPANAIVNNLLQVSSGFDREGKIANTASEVIVIDTNADFSADYQVNATGVIFDIFPTGSIFSPTIGQLIILTNSGTQIATVRILDGSSSTTLAGSERIYLQRGSNTGSQEWTYHKESVSFLLDA